MADMILARAATGATVYALVFNTEADVWDAVGSAFVPYVTEDLDDYDLPMTEQGVASRQYVVAMPSVSAGLYSIVAFVRAGGVPAETDTAIGSGEAHWDGDSFPLLSDIDANTLTASNNSVAAKDAAELAHQMLSLLSRSDASAANDFTIALAKINEDGGSGAGAYNNTTDSLEALEAGGGGLDAAGVRAAVGLGAANLDTQLDALPTNSELATALGTADDAVLAAIGVAGAALTAIPWNASWDAEVQSEVADALEATIADSVPADGTIPSVKQALYMLTQFMLERSVVGTTATIKKADGTTTLLTLTLNSATAPTSVTRAT